MHCHTCGAVVQVGDGECGIFGAISQWAGTRRAEWSSIVSASLVTTESSASAPASASASGPDGVTLVDCLHGACVVAWDGEACIESALFAKGRRRCTEPTCVSSATSRYSSRLAKQTPSSEHTQLKRARKVTFAPSDVGGGIATDGSRKAWAGGTIVASDAALILYCLLWRKGFVKQPIPAVYLRAAEGHQIVHSKGGRLAVGSSRVAEATDCARCSFAALRAQQAAQADSTVVGEQRVMMHCHAMGGLPATMCNAVGFPIAGHRCGACKAALPASSLAVERVVPELQHQWRRDGAIDSQLVESVGSGLQHAAARACETFSSALSGASMVRDVGRDPTLSKVGLSTAYPNAQPQVDAVAKLGSRAEHLHAAVECADDTGCTLESALAACSEHRSSASSEDMLSDMLADVDACADLLVDSESEDTSSSSASSSYSSSIRVYAARSSSPSVRFRPFRSFGCHRRRRDGEKRERRRMATSLSRGRGWTLCAATHPR